MEGAPFRHARPVGEPAELDFRGFAGTIAGGTVRPGDEIRVLPRDTRSRVERIVTYDGDLDAAVAGQAVTLTLADEIDASRGDMIAAADAPPGVADQFEATVVWMADDPMYRGRNYLMRIGSQIATATIAPLKYKLNVDSREHLAATKLELNEIGVCDLELDRRVAFDPYDENRETGRLHPHRPHHQRHGRRGDAALRAAPLGQPALAGGRRRQARCGRRQKARRRASLVHRPLGRGQVDDRQPRRGRAAPPRLPHLHARRRQRPPRPQQGPRLHRRPTASRTSAASARSRG